jgi:hypothetical protein
MTVEEFKVQVDAALKRMADAVDRLEAKYVKTK